MIMHSKSKTYLDPVLPYITWGLIWNPQNKRGIPVFIKKNINNKYSTNKPKGIRYYNDATY